MHYDPIKEYLDRIFNKRPFLRKLFYVLLDILLATYMACSQGTSECRQTNARRA